MVDVPDNVEDPEGETEPLAVVVALGVDDNVELEDVVPLALCVVD